MRCHSQFFKVEWLIKEADKWSFARRNIELLINRWNYRLWGWEDGYEVGGGGGGISSWTSLVLATAATGRRLSLSIRQWMVFVRTLLLLFCIRTAVITRMIYQVISSLRTIHNWWRSSIRQKSVRAFIRRMQRSPLRRLFHCFHLFIPFPVRFRKCCARDGTNLIITCCLTNITAIEAGFCTASLPETEHIFMNTT